MFRLFQKRKKEQKQDSKDDHRTNQQARRLKSHAASILEEEKYLRDSDGLEGTNEKSLTKSKHSKTSKEKEKTKQPALPQIECKKINYKKKEDCLDYAKEQVEIINMARQQLVESKVEYGAVSSYLTDIQKIDRMHEDDREHLSDAARKVVALTHERTRFQNREVKISEPAYKTLERYEDTIPKELEEMKKNEAYELLVKKDLENLEGEKAVLTYERDSLDQKKSYLQCISIIVVLLLGILFFMFAIFHSRYNTEVRIPVMITVTVGIVAALLLFLENNKTVSQIRLNDRKLNKAIGLTNKVKIKFVNNRNNLDYVYQKLRVNDSKELEYLWKEYVKLKEETKRYQKNLELLELNRRYMLEELRATGVEDSEVWLYQPQALVDEKEMVEVRHRLNNRRQKLREQIDYNNRLVESAEEEVAQVLEHWPELDYEIAKLVKND